jgi:aminoethylphosphonate catabolism LysR family transcriptional regulator
MSPTQSRAFNAVAQEGSFTAAARLLNVSQPTVTTQIKGLETHYGVELFHRHGRGVRLSDTGRQLLAITRRIHAGQQEAVEFLHSVRELRSGHLKVGAYGPYGVIEMVARFARRYPGVRISVTFANSRQLQDEVLSHQLDLAVVGQSGEHSEFHLLPYSAPRLVAIVGKDHPWSHRKSIGIKALGKQPLVCREAGSEARRTLEQAIERVGLKPRNAMEIGSREGVLAAAALGIGVGVVFDEGFIPDASVTKLAISDAAVAGEVDLVCLAERKETRMIHAFLEIAEQLVAERRHGGRAGLTPALL